MTIIKSICIAVSLMLSLSCSSDNSSTTTQDPVTENPQEEPQNLEAEDIINGINNTSSMVFFFKWD